MDESIKSDERVFSKQDFESLRNEVLRQVRPPHFLYISFPPLLFSFFNQFILDV